MGIPTRHEPVDIGALHRNAEVFSIFEAAEWTDFQHLNGFHTETNLQFSLNLIDTHLEARGMCIEVTEEIMAKVTGLPQVGRT